MLNAILERGGPWNESDCLAYNAPPVRVELLNGSLLLTRRFNPLRDAVSSELIAALGPAVRTAGLRIKVKPFVRLRPDMLTIPDLTIDRSPRLATTVEASEVSVICEVTTPCTALVCNTLKRFYYAEAGIAWYLLVEPDATGVEFVTMRLFRLQNGRYVEHASARQGETLTSDLPLPITLHADDLLDRQEPPGAVTGQLVI